MDSKVVNLDIERMIESISFQDVVRYRRDSLWKNENKLQDQIDKKKFRRLESDADHSWHLADMVLLLGPHFPELDLDKALKFALLHDKLEIFTGDDLAVGISGTGLDSHAFNNKLKLRKHQREEKALAKYLASLPEDVAAFQRPIFAEYLAKASPEALFVNALDKIQVFVRILYAKKAGDSFYRKTNKAWWNFVENYHKPKVAGFPELIPYSEELLRRIKSRH